MFDAFRKRRFVTIIAFLFATCATSLCFGATVEMLDGTKIECKVLSKDDAHVTIEVMMNDMVVKRMIPLAKVHRVVINEKIYVINERSDGDRPLDAANTTKGQSPTKSTRPGGASSNKPVTIRTKAEVEKLINERGRTPPEWYDETPLNYPQTLDLSWPEGAPPGGWNNQKNVGQYVWDIINPNPNKWREGVRLMHHLLTIHKDDPAKRVRIMTELGRMYANLHEDYARAAFWWRQAGVEKTNAPAGVAVHLAECYWRLGNKAMAVEYLRKINPAPYVAIKLWADMGEPEQALKIADAAAKSGGQPFFAYLYAADACRVAGRTKDALSYYQKVVALPDSEANKGQVDRCKRRAAASIEAIKLYDASDVKKVADGAHRASSIGYEGPVEVEATVKGGRLESLRVTKHTEKQFYSAMNDTTTKILAKQSVRGVDATSGATITSEAIINATAKALASGAK